MSISARHPRTITTRIAISLLLISLSGLTQVRLVDQQASAYINQILKHSLVTFGVARGLNGVISVAQGTELALEPAGVGISLAVGQVLDPINDLIERFSWIMLASSTSLGIQSVLLDLGAAKVISFAIIGLSVLITVFMWAPGLAGAPASPLLIRTLILLCFIRFTIVAIALVSHQISVYYFNDKIAASTYVLQQTTEHINEVEHSKPVSETGPSTGIRARLQRLFDNVTNSFDAEKKLAYYQKITAEAVNHIVTLAALFIVQTVLIPLFFLWGLMRSLRYLLKIF
ncbi:MAG: hypothetical protein JKY89_11970 [Immundisolibacteraceae bacterium]|nr:hypothetical protein [Immundisolibacteraceae bacterium]